MYPTDKSCKYARWCAISAVYISNYTWHNVIKGKKTQMPKFYSKSQNVKNEIIT